MIVIGVTGGSGSGKTTFLQAVQEKNGLVIDCDAVYHRLLRENQKMLLEIEKRFPNTVENGVLQRKKLASIVFADANALLELNAITHRYVAEQVMLLLRQSDAPIAAIDAIGLFESGLDKICHTVICVQADYAVRVQRLMARDGITAEAAAKRIAAQRSDEAFASLCKHILYNKGTKNEFFQQCSALLEEICKGVSK